MRNEEEELKKKLKEIFDRFVFGTADILLGALEAKVTEIGSIQIAQINDRRAAKILVCDAIRSAMAQGVKFTTLPGLERE